MNSIVEVPFAALATQNIIEWGKAKGWLKGGIAITCVSIVVNYIILLGLTLADNVDGGQRLTISLVRATGAAVLSALYHDWRKTIV